MTVTKVKSKTKNHSKKFAKNGKKKTMKKNMSRRGKSMRGGSKFKPSFKPPSFEPPRTRITGTPSASTQWNSSIGPRAARRPAPIIRKGPTVPQERQSRWGNN